MIPHPIDSFDFKLLEEYDDVAEVYVKGPTGEIGSGRIQAYGASEGELKRLCREVHDRDCEVNVVVNATCFGGEQFTRRWVRKTLGVLERLHSAGVDALTVADPYLIDLIRHYGFPFKIVVSILASVTDPVRARYFDELGVDRISLSPDVNRSPEVIKSIRRAVSCELGILLNEGCLLNCPYRRFLSLIHI